MVEPLEIPEDWEGYEDRLVKHRLDRELDIALLSGRREYADHRERMPADARRRDEQQLMAELASFHHELGLGRR